MARPRKEIDLEQVEKLAAINCSMAEIASIVGCSVDTLQRNYAVVIEKGRHKMRVSLKRKQYELAMEGDRTMLVWLGKIILGQRDQAEVKVSYLRRVIKRLDGTEVVYTNEPKEEKEELQ